jgi:hypothetical protein
VFPDTNLPPRHPIHPVRHVILKKPVIPPYVTLETADADLDML